VPSGSSTLDPRWTDRALRAVVWEVSHEDALAEAAQRFGCSGSIQRVDLASAGLPVEGLVAPTPPTVPVLHVLGAPTSPVQAAALLRGVVHPLIGLESFVVGFEMERSFLAPASLSLGERWKLELRPSTSVISSHGSRMTWPGSSNRSANSSRECKSK